MKEAPSPQVLAPFWRFLTDWLRNRNWSQVRLADEVGVHETVVGKWLHADSRRRSRPGTRTAARLAAVLDVSIDLLMSMVQADLDDIEGERIAARRTAQALRVPTDGHGAEDTEAPRPSSVRRAALISIVRDDVPEEHLTALETMLSGYRLLRKFLPEGVAEKISGMYLASVFADKTDLINAPTEAA